MFLKFQMYLGLVAVVLLLISTFIVFWLMTVVWMLAVLWNLLGLALWPRIWSVFINISCVFFIGWRVLFPYPLDEVCNIHFIIFCIFLYFIAWSIDFVRCVLKSLTIILNCYIHRINSVFAIYIYLTLYC